MSKVQVGVQGAAQLIRSAGRLALFLHVNPDGDSIGSTLALARVLRGQLGKECVVVQVDPVPRIFEFLPGVEMFTPWQDIEGEFDLGVFLDCGDLHRVGAALPVVNRCRATLNIDHHVTNGVYGDYNYLDFRAAAVGELAYALIGELGLTVDREAAVGLYTSLVTDTGSFRYDSTTGDTHRVAAALIEQGVKPYEVSQAIFENETMGRLQLLARSLGTLQLEHDGRVATLHITRQMFMETGTTDEDSEGVVNYARSITGVEVGVFLRETLNGDIRIGLRSREKVDVGVVAQAFGGGGHARAAGCTIPGPLESARSLVLHQLKGVL